MSTKKNSNYFMRLAFQQASKVLGNTKNNPAVGCVIVKNNSVVSVASTSFNGRPHAEHNALSLLPKKYTNFSLYSTLEPCSHYGKTPPCVNKIINRKVKRVFFSINDPDKRSQNKCKKILERNKVATSTKILNSEAKDFYKSYIKSKKASLPYVSCKIAISKDHFIKNKKYKNITNSFSRGRTHLLRGMHDCIVTSSTTVIDDNPKFTCRIPGLEKLTPSRVILDKNLETPLNCNLVLLGKKYRTIIFHCKQNKKKMLKFKRMGVKLIRQPLNSNGLFDLKKVLYKIKSYGFSRIFLESGKKLADSFFKERLINVFYLFVSNHKIGNNGRSNIKNFLKLHTKKKKSEIMKINLLGDKMIKYKIR